MHEHDHRLARRLCVLRGLIEPQLEGGVVVAIPDSIAVGAWQSRISPDARIESVKS
jgi:hypothetical protein